MTLNDYQQLLGELKGLEIGSLNLERNEDSGDDELSYLPGSPQDEPLFQCLKGELRQRLMDAIETLPQKERLVFDALLPRRADDERNWRDAGRGGVAHLADPLGRCAAAAREHG